MPTPAAFSSFSRPGTSAFMRVASNVGRPCARVDERAHGRPTFDATRMKALVPGLLKEEKAAGVGIAVLRNGAVTWTGYYGEEAPGIPVSEKTVFNTASVSKTLTAETLLALAAKGQIDLDES